MAKKIFVLDTSVLLHSPQSLYSFGDNDIVIPIVVLDELDKFKRGSMEINRNARLVIKELDTLRSSGRIDKGVALSSGGSPHGGHEPPRRSRDASARLRAQQ